jgi:hypothetical protein
MLSTISNINLMRKPAAAAPTGTPATYWLAFGTGTNSIKKITPAPLISNWSSTSPSNMFTSYGYHGATNGTGTWIATGAGTNTMVRSTNNGSTWVAYNSASSFSASGFKVAYGNNMFVVSGGSGDSIGVNIRTLDSAGTNLSDCSGYFATYAWCANYIKGLWYVGGTGAGSTPDFTSTNALVVSSTNAATSWSKSSQNGLPSITGGNPINANINDISTDGTLIIMSGKGYLNNNNTNIVSTTRSTNGTDWTPCTINSVRLFEYGYQSAYGNGVWIAVGVPVTAGQCIARSTDNGTTWSYVGNGILSNGYGVAYGGNNTWVAVGSPSGQNAAISTNNGATWTGRGFPSNGNTDVIYGINSNYIP